MAVTIKGLGSLQAKLKKLDPVTRTAIGIGVQKAALKVEGDAKTRSPVDTGALRRSINTSGRSLPNGAQAEVTTNLEYAPYVELGTSRQQAQPYLQPALQRNKDTARKIIMTEIVKAHRGL